MWPLGSGSSGRPWEIQTRIDAPFLTSSHGYCREPSPQRKASAPKPPSLQGFMGSNGIHHVDKLSPWTATSLKKSRRTAKPTRPRKHDYTPVTSAVPASWKLAFMQTSEEGHSSGGGHYARKSQTLRSKQGTRPGIIRPSPAPTLPGVPDDPSAVSTKQSGEQQPLLQEPEPSQGPSIPSGSPSRSAVDQRPSLSSVDQMVKSEAGLQKLFAPGPSWKKRRMDGLAGSMEDNVHGSIRSLLESRASKLVVDPRSPSFMLWDVCITMVVAYTALLVPYELSFVNFGTLNSYLKSAFFSMNRLVDLVYFIDILLTCITMYYDKDNQIWVSDQRLIFIKYARSWLVPDLITMIPFDVIILSGTGDVEVNVNVVKLLRMMKLLRIWRSSRLQDKLEEAVSLDYGIVELIKNLGMLCLITHWLACMFGLLTSAHAQVNWAKVYFEDMAAATPSPESDTPLSMASPGTGSDSPSPTPTQTPSSHELSAERWQACGVDLPMTHVDCYTGIQLYLAALYWSTMTVTTIGYGDIVPTNMTEQLLVIIAMLVGGVVFGYIVGVFAGIISSQDQQKKRNREEIRDLDALAKESRLPKAKAKELRSFFKFLHASRAMSMSAYQPLLTRMSPGLRGQVTRLTDKNWVERLPYFRNVPETFVVELVQALGCQAFPPGETIFNYGDENKQMYVIKQGVVSCGGRVLTPGCTFCEESLYKPGSQGQTAVTFTYTYVYTLERSVFHQIVRGYPAVERQFRLMSIRRLFREEVCSYAYAVQALFDDYLISAVEKMVKPDFTPDGMDRQLTLQGYNKEDLKELGQGLFVPVKRSQSQSNAGPRQQAFKIARAAPRIHPLWSHLNAIRVHHYYEKLRMITRISDEEAERLDRSVLLIQKWVRGCLARRSVRKQRRGFEKELQAALMMTVPATIHDINSKLEEIRAEIKVRHGDAQAENRQPNLANPSRERFQTLEDKVEKLEVQLEQQNDMLRSMLSLLQAQERRAEPEPDARSQPQGLHSRPSRDSNDSW